MQSNHLAVIAADIPTKYKEKSNDRSVSWSIFYPPILDTIRIATRTAVIQSPYKLAPFPTFEELYERLLTKMSTGLLRIAANREEAEFNVRLFLVP